MGEGLLATLGVAAIVLLALLVGALLPVFFEARATLRRARRFLDEEGRRVDRLLGEAGDLVARANRVTTDLEPRVQALSAALEEAHKAVRVASALAASVGPAVVAAVRAYRSVQRDGQDSAGPGVHEQAGNGPGG